ncbi:MAG: glycosyltransferase [Pseudomonadota bacterium]
MEREKHLKVVVATLTRERPEMLKKLLFSWSNMALPPNIDAQCLVVENDDSPKSLLVVEACSTFANGLALKYVHETELGIPFARNRAAREALESGADLLAFVDDDERVDSEWLVELVRTHRETGAELIGGPVRVELGLADPSLTERMIFGSLEQRFRRKENRACAKTRQGGTDGVTIVTSNWLARTGLFRDHGLWFDEKMRFTGGTDAKFYAEVREKGLKTAWSHKAIVYEEIPSGRLSLGYQFKRGRNQSSSAFHRKLMKNRLMALTLLVIVPFKLLAVVALIVALPFTRGLTLADIARTSGGLLGRFDALLGRRSDLYEVVTGE